MWSGTVLRQSQVATWLWCFTRFSQTQMIVEISALEIWAGHGLTYRGFGFQAKDVDGALITSGGLTPITISFLTSVTISNTSFEIPVMAIRAQEK